MYSIIAALHHQDIAHDPGRINSLKPFIFNYNWKDINFPARKDNWYTFERNSKDIALNILSAKPNEKRINPIYISDYKKKREEQVYLLMITDSDDDDSTNEWHYLAIKSISRLFRGVTSTNNGDFYCINCLYSFRTNNKLKKHERLCDNNKFCEVIMPQEVKSILKYNSGEKSLKAAHMFYLDLEALLIKHPSVQNNPDNSYTEKKATHIPSGYALNLVRSYNSNKNTRTYYRGENCIGHLCKNLRTQAIDKVNLEEKEMIPLTQREQLDYEQSEYCHICEKKFCIDRGDKKKFKKY